MFVSYNWGPKREFFVENCITVQPEDILAFLKQCQTGSEAMNIGVKIAA